MKKRNQTEASKMEYVLVFLSLFWFSFRFRERNLLDFLLRVYPKQVFLLAPTPKDKGFTLEVIGTEDFLNWLPQEKTIDIYINPRASHRLFNLRTYYSEEEVPKAPDPDHPPFLYIEMTKRGWSPWIWFLNQSTDNPKTLFSLFGPAKASSAGQQQPRKGKAPQ